MRKVLERLREHKPFVSPTKCSFIQKEVDLLGVVIGEEVLKVNPGKTVVVRNWPKTESISVIRSSIGLVAFFRQFIRNFGEVSRPLTEITKQGKSIVQWDEEFDQVFSMVKKLLIASRILGNVDWKLSFNGHVDKYQFAIGEKINQTVEKRENVIAYYS